MPERAAAVNYQGFDPEAQRLSTPQTETPHDYLTPEAKPQTEVGQALEKIGGAAEQVGDKTIDLATHYAEMATEAKANDVIANQFAPAAAKLKADFYQNQGIDALKAQPAYQNSLSSLREQFLSQATSPYEKQILSTWTSRHAAQENDGAAMYANQQLTKYEDDTQKAMLDTTSSMMTQNYNRPDVVDTNMASGLALIQKHGIDRGQSPEEIQENMRQYTSKAAQDMVGRAVAGGDVTTAQQLYAKYQDKISGPEQLNIDKMLHTENMRQFGTNAASALLTGKPVPYAPIGTTTQVKAAVADSAQSSGIDPNHALTVASIESDFGQNVGKRGDIGQTGKPGDLQEQAQNLTTELKKSETVADNALGRKSEPWEQYVCYQQGASGGPALLKAASDQPLAKAVDVLKPLYDSPKEALSAVVDNGGNATMTAGQFLNLIKSKYELHAGQAQMSLPQTQAAPAQTPIPNDQQTLISTPPQSPGNAILAPHETGGLAVQPAVSPQQKLLELDKVYPDAVMRANQIPNIDQREATLRALEQTHQVYQAAANAYSTQLINQADKLANDHKFTSMDQVPPEMSATLLSDHPQTLQYLENRANYNLEHASGVVSKDAKEYGPGYNDVLHDIWDGKITSVTQLHQAQVDGQITMAGVDRFTKELNDNGNPAIKDSEKKMQANAFTVVRSQLTHGMSEDLIKMNPDIQKKVASADIALFNAIDERKSRNIPPGQYYDPNNKEFIGNDAKVFQLTQAQALAAKVQGGKQAVKPRSMGDILGEALKYKNDPSKQSQLRQEAIDAGYFDPNAPLVPMSQ